MVVRQKANERLTSAPHLLGGLYDEAELSELLLVEEDRATLLDEYPAGQVDPQRHLTNPLTTRCQRLRNRRGVVYA